jgi:AcrR family transcriptional regulator
MGHKGYRRDGLTPERKARVYEGLERFGTVADACRAAGISTTTFYRHEKKDAEFRSICAAARSKAAARIELLAWERGVTGIEEEVIHYGKVVGTRRKRSDAVFRMILQASDPEKYGRQGEAMRARIEKELRAKIEAEVRAEIAAAAEASRRDAGELFDELAERIARMEAEEIAEEARGRAGSGGEGVRGEG